MSKIYTSADQLIGHTPLLELLTIIKQNRGLPQRRLFLNSAVRQN